MRINDYNCKYFSTNAALSAFLSDVRKYSVPTEKEEEELVNKAKSGDERAKSDLICRNLRFIYSLAKIYARNENEVLDYVNEGVLGFEKALEKFDPTLGNKFNTYGVWYIRRAMNFYLTDTRNIINRSNSNKFGRKIDSIKQKHYAENGREPTIDEIRELIKKYYDIDVKNDSDLFDVNVISINDEIDDDYTIENTSDYNEKTSSQNGYEKEIEMENKREIISEILSTLPEKHADIIKMLFGLGEYEREYTIQEVADKYKVRCVNIIKTRDKTLEYLKQNSSIAV